MTERHRHRPAAGADRPSPGGRRRLRFGLMSRIALALALVGLLPLAVAALRLIDLNRDALRDQATAHHSSPATTPTTCRSQPSSAGRSSTNTVVPITWMYRCAPPCPTGAATSAS